MLDDELFVFKDAAKFADTSANALLEKLVSKDIPLLYKPSSLLHLYCLSTDISKTAPFAPFKGFLDDNRTLYQEINDFDYIIVESNSYENILNTKVIKIILFNRIVRFNFSKEICIASAKDIALKEPDNNSKSSAVLKYLSTSASFCFFENKNPSPPFKLKNRVITFPPINPYELDITIDQLWVRDSDLKNLYPSILQLEEKRNEDEKLSNEKKEREDRAMLDEIIKLEKIDVTENWMNDNLKLLNKACMKFLIERKLNGIENDEQAKSLTQLFISEQYYYVNKKEISETVLTTCLDVVITEQPKKNMRNPSSSERSRYHAAITPAVVNMNEFCRKYGENVDIEKNPSLQAVKDKADEEKILPKGITHRLAKFLLPKF